MKSFEEILKESLLEGIFDNNQESYPYVDKVSEYLGVDKEDMYNFIRDSLAYMSLEDLEKAKLDEEIEEKEYEIHKKFFESFGKDEFELTDEDLEKIGTTREEYNKVHDDLV